jgi:signal transduction histidine kinase
MNARLIIRMTAPIVAISLLLLAVAVGSAWHVQRWQKAVNRDLRVTVSGLRAAEELEILVREARTRLDHFLITSDRKYLAQVPDLHAETEHWLGEAERWGLSPHERQLMTQVRKGHEHFWRELHASTNQVSSTGLPDQIRRLIAILVKEVLEPAHEYLDVTELDAESSIEENQVFADRLVYVLLLLGTCGSAAGLVAGLGFARGLSRSLIQLSVLIRDTAGRLGPGVEAITFSRGDLGELENVLRLIADRVAAIVERLQQQEHEVLRAEQLAAVGQLAAGMAHELRNPLTSMKLLVQGALAGPAEERGLSNRDLSVMEEEITRLERLVQSFLDFARPPQPEKRVVDVRPLVEQTLAFTAARAAAASAQVEFLAPPEPVRAAVDTAQFRQVLLNLVLNALDALPAEGTIVVGLESAPDGWLVLQVADSGCGLPAALGDRIFDPFTTTRETGLGLGLSICKRIAAAHGGTLTAANRPGGGAVFTLRLPPSAGQAFPSDATVVSGGKA